MGLGLGYVIGQAAPRVHWVELGLGLGLGLVIGQAAPRVHWVGCGG